ncbi:MAG: YciI family protein [Gemmatimonadales bacterium]
MRFMIMVKSTETSAPPPKALMDAIAKLGEESSRAGVLVETAGLYPTATAARVRLTGGKVTATDGPFTEAKEVVGGYAVYDVRSRHEAVRWTARFMDLHQEHWKGWEGEAEIRQIFEAPEFAKACG